MQYLFAVWICVSRHFYEKKMHIYIPRYRPSRQIATSMKLINASVVTSHCRHLSHAFYSKLALGIICILIFIHKHRLRAFLQPCLTFVWFSLVGVATHRNAVIQHVRVCHTTVEKCRDGHKKNIHVIIFWFFTPLSLSLPLKTFCLRAYTTMTLTVSQILMRLWYWLTELIWFASRDALRQLLRHRSDIRIYVSGVKTPFNATNNDEDALQILILSVAYMEGTWRAYPRNYS